MQGDAVDLNRDLFEGGAAHSDQVNFRLRCLYFDLLDGFAKPHIDFCVKVEYLEIALRDTFR